MPNYRHTQSGTVVVAALGVGVVLTIAVLLSVPGSGVRVATGVTLAILLLCAVLFYSLTVEVTADEVVVSFGPGVIRRRFLLQDVRGARKVRNPWYYGWGIRFTPQGWLFNVSGLDAVELEFDGDRRVRIGTDDPEGLSTAIRPDPPGRCGTCPRGGGALLRGRRLAAQHARRNKVRSEAGTLSGVAT